MTILYLVDELKNENNRLSLALADDAKKSTEQRLIEDEAAVVGKMAGKHDNNQLFHY